MSRRLAAPIATLVQLLIAYRAVLAHEHRQVGESEMIVGVLRAGGGHRRR